MTWGIVAEGFLRKTEEEIRTSIEDRIASAFGPVYVDPDSVLGREVDAFVTEMTELWEQLENVYYSQYRTTAAGESLTQAVRNIGESRLEQLQTRVIVTITGTPATVILAGSTVEISATGDRFDTIEEAIIAGGGTVDVEVRSQEYGEIQAPALAIDTIVTPISGWDSVSNAAQEFLLGREVETDIELRARSETDLRVGGKGTDEAIRTHLRQDVDGVTGASVISNRTSATVSGRPPHSFEALVQGGDQDEIASVIWDNMPSGIEPHGTTTVIVADSQGDNQTIKFSRPVEVEYYVRVTLTKTAYYPDGGDDEMEAAILAYAEETFDIGDELVQHFFYTPVNMISGVTEAIIELGTDDGYSITYSEDNIAIAANEIGSLLGVTIVGA